MALFEQKYPNSVRTITGLVNPIFQDDVILLCNTSLGAVAIQLTTIPVDKWNTTWKLYVVDTSTNASVNNITITAPVGYLINGASNIIINSNSASLIVRIASNTNFAGQYSAGIGGGAINVEIVGNAFGTLLTASTTGGVAPYTYLWSEAQNVQNRFLVGVPVQTPSTPLNLINLGIALVGAVTPNGTSVMWKCKVTDAIGNVGIGYFTNVSQGA